MVSPCEIGLLVQKDHKTDQHSVLNWLSHMIFEFSKVSSWYSVLNVTMLVGAFSVIVKLQSSRRLVSSCSQYQYSASPPPSRQKGCRWAGLGYLLDTSSQQPSRGPESKLGFKYSGDDKVLMETTHGDRRPTFTIYFCLKPYSDGEICIWDDELLLDRLLCTASCRHDCSQIKMQNHYKTCSNTLFAKWRNVCP